MLGFGKKKEKNGEAPKKKGDKQLEGVVFHVMPSLAGAGEITMHEGQGAEAKKADKKESKEVHPLKRQSLTPPARQKPTHKEVSRPPVLAGAAPAAHGAGKAIPAHHKSRWPWLLALMVIIVGGGGVGFWYWSQLQDIDSDVDRGRVALSQNENQQGGSATAQPKIPSTAEPSAPVVSAAPHFLADRGLLSARDLDADLLTDAEEALYGTDPNTPDTDADGWPDGWETVHLYDPMGGDSKRLIDNEGITGFENARYGYTMLHPTTWVVQSIDGADPKEVIITSDTGEFIKVSVMQPAADELGFFEDGNIEAFVRSRYPGGSRYTLHDVENEFDLPGVQTSDGLTHFILGESAVYMIRYEPGLRERVNFKRTLNTIVAGFFVESVPLAVPDQQLDEEEIVDETEQIDAQQQTQDSADTQVLIEG